MPGPGEQSKLARLRAALPDTEQRVKYAIAVVILVISLACLPPCWRNADRVDSLLLPYRSQTAGYDDIGQRLSMRFRDSDPGSQQSRYRWQLQRELGMWNLFIGLCVLGASGSLIYLSRPSWGWWRRTYERWVVARRQRRGGGSSSSAPSSPKTRARGAAPSSKR